MGFDIGIYLLLLSVALSLIYFGVLSVVYRMEAGESKLEDAPKFSIIIAAKNEADNLEKHIPLILSQLYEGFEVIVVNDNSSDGTESVMKSLSEKYKNLSYSNLEKVSGKKKAIARGVELAKYNWLLFTDADCAPSSEHWIAYMASQIQENTQMVIGYSPFRKAKGPVNALARVDAFTIGLQYLAFAILGKPYMGVGRNLAYTKTLFCKVGGFESHEHVTSGDDDLFVQESSMEENVVVEIALNAQTNSESKRSFKNWFLQKRRHTSTGFHYKLITLVVLGLIQINIVAFYILLAYNLINGIYLWETLILASVRFYSQYFVLKKSALKLGEIDLLLLSFILELPLVILNSMAAFSNIFYKNRRWS